MKKIMLGAIALFAVGTGSALAADLPAKVYTKAPPPVVAPAYNWTGWYVGGNVGGAFGNTLASETAVSGAGFPTLGAGTVLYGGTNDYRMDPGGALGGLQAGYNWQTSTNIVLGVEADIQGADIQASRNCVNPCNTPLNTVPGNGFLGLFPVTFTADNYSQRIDWFGTVRGRAGYTYGPALFYVTGGLAYGEVERRGSVAGSTGSFFGATLNSFAGSYDVSSTKTGWTVGAGVEAKLAANWSVKLEYLYVDLGNNSDVFNTVYAPGGNAVAGSVAATRTDTSSNRENIVRVGLNYGFNGPVVAKY
jgi:outer membrane immunogenic protein